MHHDLIITFSFLHVDIGAYESIHDVPGFSDRHEHCLHSSCHGAWFELYFDGNGPVRTTGMSHEKKNNRKHNQLKIKQKVM